MIIVDTSVWIDHFRASDSLLKFLLNEQQVLSHNLVIGELSLGNFKKRKVILEYLHNLPQSIHASDDEVLKFIEKNNLFGLGIGYVDVHLLASALLTEALLWTKDKRLHEVAAKLKIAYK